MSDDLDDLDDLDAALRRAMAALDGEAPPGYFEALPARTLARLDDPAFGAAIGDLPDDPGREGIRDLASQPRVRPLRVAQDRPPDDDDDDGSAFSSQLMAAVERPEPEGTLVALPRGDQAPAVPGGPVEPAPEAPWSGAASAAPVPSSRVTAGPVEAPASAAASMPSAGRPGHRRSRRARAAIVGIGGIGLAAVAVLYLAVGDRVARTASPVADGERAVTTSEQAAASPSAGGGSSMTSVAAGSAASAEQISPAGGTASGSAPTAPAPEPIGKFPAPGTKRPGKAKAPSRSGSGKFPVQGGSDAAAAGSGSAAGADRPGTDAQPSLDKPGVSGKKLKSGKPRPDRTSLSGDDIERAMTAVAGRARACAGGAQGTASLRLTVASSGRIAQVTVIGPFAGTPVGACVERAVRTATFPPWDGAPQSFDYSYLLSD